MLLFNYKKYISKLEHFIESTVNEGFEILKDTYIKEQKSKEINQSASMYFDYRSDALEAVDISQVIRFKIHTVTEESCRPYIMDHYKRRVIAALIKKIWHKDLIHFDVYKEEDAIGYEDNFQIKTTLKIIPHDKTRIERNRMDFPKRGIS